MVSKKEKKDRAVRPTRQGDGSFVLPQSELAQAKNQTKEPSPCLALVDQSLVSVMRKLISTRAVISSRPADPSSRMVIHLSLFMW